MMKKSFAILTIILAVTAFCTVSSAQAFIDPVSLTVILGTTMITLVTGAEIHYASIEKKSVKPVVYIEEIETVKEVEHTDQNISK